jgi:23S rRNA (adenine2503-C2)-methyltransferase
LIPVNKVSEKNYEKSNKIRIESFKKILTENGIETTVRRELGSDIDAACGQLRRKYLDE